MSENKEEEALCNNAQNHRQQLINHQKELDRDLEAGSCDGDEEEEEDDGEKEEGTGEEGEGETVEETSSAKKKSQIPPLYNVEPGCTALGCYSAILTFIVMVIGIVALLMYSSPANARAENLTFDDEFSTEDGLLGSSIPVTTEPEMSTQ